MATSCLRIYLQYIFDVIDCQKYNVLLDEAVELWNDADRIRIDELEVRKTRSRILESEKEEDVLILY